jgi:hypothetical protein
VADIRRNHVDVHQPVKQRNGMQRSQVQTFSGHEPDAKPTETQRISRIS